ncbi:unnamed protein product, partial [Brachionus calyciflorus]
MGLGRSRMRCDPYYRSRTGFYPSVGSQIPYPYQSPYGLYRGYPSVTSCGGLNAGYSPYIAYGGYQ